MAVSRDRELYRICHRAWWTAPPRSAGVQPLSPLNHTAPRRASSQAQVRHFEPLEVDLARRSTPGDPPEIHDDHPIGMASTYVAP